MTRVQAMLATLVVLAALALVFVDINSDADAIFPADAAGPAALDTAAGREIVVALAAPDQTVRNAAARDVVAMLGEDPLVAVAWAGPTAFSKPLLDWVWEHRFRFAPPAPEDLTVAALAARLAEARGSLSGAEGMMLADRMLRDPTGSFARLIGRFDRPAANLAQADGIWQSRDDSAALVFVTLADVPFDADATAALAERIRARAAAGSATAMLLGARIVSAEIGADTAHASVRAALIAGALLLAWFAWTLQSLRTLILAFLPLALGFASACLAVQLAFGSVHVVVLGFGGALIGLALDYSLHLLGHPGVARRGAERLVLLGAATTVVGFLAMLGSGVLALKETGLFVATGLGVAALASWTVPADASVARRAPPIERLAWRMPLRPWIEAALVIVGILSLAGSQGGASRPLFEPPEHVRNTIETMGEMVELPSGRHALLVEGENLAELLSREAAVEDVLAAAERANTLGRYTMLSHFLPAAAAVPDALDGLPTVEVFAQRAEDALRQAGMAPTFAAEQAEVYRLARQAPAIAPADLASFPETLPLAARLERTAAGWRETVRLFSPSEPERLAAAIAERGVPGVRMIDLTAPIESGLAELRRRVLLWLGMGALAAFTVLAVGHADWRRAAAIARTTGAATGLTATLLTSFGGALGVFEIVALTLVVGIGIDYGLFLDRRETPDVFVLHCRSVALCAVSTLVAFAVMAASPVTLLQEIGLTVSLGVLAMVVLHLAETPPSRAREQ